MRGGMFEAIVAVIARHRLRCLRRFRLADLLANVVRNFRRNVGHRGTSLAGGRGPIPANLRPVSGEPSIQRIATVTMLLATPFCMSTSGIAGPEETPAGIWML